MIQFFKQLSGRLGSNIYAGFGGTNNPQNMAFVRELQKEMKKNNSLDLPLHELKEVVFDFETTGFYPERGDQVISIGAVKMTGTEVHHNRTFYSLLKTDTPLSNEISQLTGIQQEELINAESPKVVLLEFLGFIGTQFLVAHHSKHEQSFMQRMSWDLLKTRFEHRIIDTSFLIRLKDPFIKPLPLEDLCASCGIEVKNRHHALGDALMTAQIWSHYLLLAQKKGFYTLREIYEYIAKFC
jgi:DNA polymerase-3 subunit epsilon